ncbi:APC family permease [Nocardia sp. NPDC058176]|uniref:APC family permease n=1 Tax=Nocardia sp. NPDC058176 TaxID=3346368 RepID=UPI0036DF0FB9
MSASETLRGNATPVPGDNHSGGAHLRRVLGLPSLVLFGLVYMVPLTIFTTYGLITDLTGGRLPTTYLITLVAMLFTAWSYGAMARAYPLAGSAYSYTSKSFGGSAGFAAGWSLLLDYLFLPMINYLLIGLYLNAQFPAVPAWVFVLAAIAVVTILNVVGISSVAKASGLIVTVQAIFVVVFIAISIATIMRRGGPDLLAPFTGAGGEWAPLFAGAAILCLSFLGFDAVSTLAEETRDPTRNIPRAIMATTVIAGLIFVSLSYVGHLVFPSHEFADVDSGSLDVMTSAGGNFLAVFFTAAYIAGSLGSALTAQASVSRILYSMGREGVLPRNVFGRISMRFGTPVIAVLIVSVISLFALVLDLTTLASMISFGALAAFSAVNLSVIKHYVIDRQRKGRNDIVLYGILPTIGFALTVWLWTSLSATALVIGIGWLAAGLAILGVLTRGFRRPPPSLNLEH